MTEKMKAQANRLFMNMFGTLGDYDSKAETMTIYTKGISKNQLASLSRLMAKSVQINYTATGIQIIVCDYELQ